MINIKMNLGDLKEFNRLEKINNMTKKGIASAFHALGKDLKEESIKLMETTERDVSKAYLVKINGIWVKHHPSRANHPAAIMTGKLKKTVNYNVNGSDTLTFGAGDKKKINYARPLELGNPKNNLAPRPYLKPSIKNNEGNAYTHLKTQILKELNK